MNPRYGFIILGILLALFVCKCAVTPRGTAGGASGGLKISPSEELAANLAAKSRFRMTYGIRPENRPPGPRPPEIASDAPAFVPPPSAPTATVPPKPPVRPTSPPVVAKVAAPNAAAPSIPQQLANFFSPKSEAPPANLAPTSGQALAGGPLAFGGGGFPPSSSSGSTPPGASPAPAPPVAPVQSTANVKGEFKTTGVFEVTLNNLTDFQFARNCFLLVEVNGKEQLRHYGERCSRTPEFVNNPKHTFEIGEANTIIWEGRAIGFFDRFRPNNFFLSRFCAPSYTTCALRASSGVLEIDKKF